MRKFILILAVIILVDYTVKEEYIVLSGSGTISDIVYYRLPTDKEKRIYDINIAVNEEIKNRQDRKMEWNRSQGRNYAPSPITKEEIEVIRVEIEKEIK